MVAIRWLHLTDLHHGMAEQASLLPAVRQQLFQDLERIAAVAGPWDLVLFTGDLTQTGVTAEFDALTETLERLWTHLARQGSRPFLLAVPGNHDLRRPRASAVVRALRHWHDEREVREEFWRDADNEYRRAIDEAFAPYVAWLSVWQRAHPPPPGLEVSLDRGPLPGDFAATVSKDGLTLGVVGLNSAFLQLTSDDYEGFLHLDPRQLHGACGGDAPDWIERRHVNLLLTHHPPEWLHVGSRGGFQAEIALPGWFEAHLFGHMHEPTAEFRHMAGAPGLRRIQGASVFGLERWGDGREHRIHGYSAGRIALAGGAGKLSLWPRIAVTVQAGYRKLVPDHSFELDRDEAFHAPLPIRALASARPSLSGATSTSGAPLQDPGGPYDPRWYVPPVNPARDTLERLLQPGQPVAIWGPELFGKTWLLRHTLCHLAARGVGGHVAQVNLRLVDADALASLDLFLRRFAAIVAESLGLDAAVVDEAGKRPGTTPSNLRWLFERRLFPAAEGPLVLAIDQADELVQHPVCDGFFTLLRGWSDLAGAEPWSRLRLVVAMSTTPVLVTTAPTRSPFANAAAQVRLTDLDAAQVAELARKHRLSWSERDIDELMALVGGHPFLVRLVMVNAARNHVALGALLDESSQVFEPFLDGLRWRLSKDRWLLEVFRGMLGDPHRTADPVGYLRLRQAGVIHRVSGVYQLRYRLYERLVHTRRAAAP